MARAAGGSAGGRAGRSRGAQHTSAQVFKRAVQEVHAKFKDVKDGAPADVIRELAKVSPELFGVALVTAGGEVHTAGDVDYAFSCGSPNSIR
jgi:glutaminase